MARTPEDGAEFSDIEEQLAESQAQIEALQTAAADAEARARTARAELAEAHKQIAGLQEQLESTASEREAALGELASARSELSAAQAGVREAAVRYRAARLAQAPDIPEELVPELESLDEIDARFDEARRLVGRVRDRIEEQKEEEARAFRVPAGSSRRRAQDTASLSAADKIKLGLEQASGREVR